MKKSHVVGYSALLLLLGSVCSQAQQSLTSTRNGDSNAGGQAVSNVSGTSSPEQKFATQVNFDGSNGANPYLMFLVQGTDGDLYGTTSSDGANGLGTVFKVTPSGTLTTLHSFVSTEGSHPYAGLMLGTDGNFYGTTSDVGTNTYGTVFKITSGGALTILHRFDNTDGAYPQPVLAEDPNGNFYGTTSVGGNLACNGGCGTVFKMTKEGKLATLHSFDSTDGNFVLTGIVQGIDGSFYGTTAHGGTYGYGTVFKITSGGKLTTLHSFDSTHGNYSAAALVQAPNGVFYGATSQGGTYSYGTVFKITPGGELTDLHSFDSTDGSTPYAGLVLGTDGNFYGTTQSGGANGDGTVFKITPGGMLTTLHNFDGTDGDNYPLDPGLVQATNGTFYGTTDAGGANNDGTVFSLSVGLGPFVETQPSSGEVGAAVKILGTDLTGATSVTFNGTAAVFKMVSTSLITTNIPTGATSGTVEVTTPKGTLKSNVVFRVTK
jgi:uncharacterized repeat protein (TIGR03803 family)